MRVDVQINGSDMSVVADRAMEAALFDVAEQALGDCNKYAPYDYGGLMDSSVIHSDTDSAELVWDMPYAQYLYFGLLMLADNGSAWAKSGESKHLTNIPLSYSKDKHPLAQSHWCEVAENNHRQQWDITFRNTLRSNGL